MSFHVRPLESKDATRWAELYNAYRKFCGEAQSDRIVVNASKVLARRLYDSVAVATN